MRYVELSRLTLFALDQKRGMSLHRDQWQRTDKMRKEKYVKREERTNAAEELMELI
jgi:hypothetical protein